MSPLIAAGTLIVHVAFDAYIVILLLRLLLQKLGANWHNPFSQFIIQLTEKPLTFLRKIAPGFKGFDTAILLFAIILQFVEITLLCLLQFGGMPAMLGALVMTLGEIMSKFVYIYLYGIIINAIASWFPQSESHPILQLINLIIEPVLSPIRRYVPLIAGIDFSPVIALLVLTLINMLAVTPILQAATRIILG
ncbi:MAG: YggT family protein [Gammaproteobacteria bacterium]|nr:YggT family protein [Gammaproteobacteria bacterium]